MLEELVAAQEADFPGWWPTVALTPFPSFQKAPTFANQRGHLSQQQPDSSFSSSLPVSCWFAPLTGLWLQPGVPQVCHSEVRKGT